jgi:hypothetical protein
MGGRAALAGARAAAASTGIGVALVAGSLVTEAIVMQEIENPGKTGRDISNFFTGLLGSAVVSRPDTTSPTAPIHDSFRIESGRAVVSSNDNGRAGVANIQFATNLDWWTAVVIRDVSGNVIEISKVDRKYSLHRNRQMLGATNVAVIPIASLPSQVSIEFWTAKTFGVHKQLVIMKYRKERLNGRTVSIGWTK